MEGLVRLVAESLARHGVNFTPARPQWSDWKKLEPSLCLAAPSHAGLFVLAERVLPHRLAPTVDNAQAHYAVFHEGRSNDLGFEMGRLCSPYSPLRSRIVKGDCWVRYTVTPLPAPERVLVESALAEPVLAESPRPNTERLGSTYSPVLNASLETPRITTGNIPATEYQQPIP